jgi:hypothetical protein
MKAEYEIVEETSRFILIRDTGHDRGCRSVTNDAENVVAELAPRLRNRELHYIDSEGSRDRLLHANGRFVGFAPL